MGMESIIRDVTSLNDAQRQSLEALLGHELRGSERIYLAVLNSPSAASTVDRQREWETLERLAASAETNLRAHGVSADQWTNIVDAECEVVRYGDKS